MSYDVGWLCLSPSEEPTRLSSYLAHTSGTSSNKGWLGWARLVPTAKMGPQAEPLGSAVWPWMHMPLIDAVGLSCHTGLVVDPVRSKKGARAPLFFFILTTRPRRFFRKKSPPGNRF